MTSSTLSDSGIDLTKKKYYRYWEGTFNASSNPGHPHALKLVVDFEGARKFDWTDSTFDEDFLTASHASLESYGAAYLEYDSSHRVNEAFFRGQCGCASSSDGTHEYEYESNGSFSGGAGYDTDWHTRTVVKRPDGSYHTQYFDEVKQPLTSVITDADPDNTSPSPEKWATQITRDSNGAVTEMAMPDANSAYTHSSGAITQNSSSGLIWTFGRDTAGTRSFKTNRKFKEGSSGTAYKDGAWGWEEPLLTPTGSDKEVIRPLVSSSREFTEKISSGSSGSNLWDYDYTQHSGTLATKEITVTQPAVSTSKNGSGSSVTTKQYFNADGDLAFEKSGSGIITYREYTDGQLTKLIRNADTTKTGSGEDFENVTVPTGFSSSGSPIHSKTEYAYDAQGRQDTRTLPGGRIEKWYYSNLSDEQLISAYYPKYTSTPKFWGPARWTVSNHGGTSTGTTEIAFSGGTTTSAPANHVNEAQQYLRDAPGVGTNSSATTFVTDDSGTSVQESRLYHTIPGSGEGSEGTNYDSTYFGYDDMGRRTRVKEPSGTVRRTVFDIHGRVTERWIGTNDSSFDGGEPSGTDNMVKTEAMEYDSGNDDGNGLVTKRTLYVEDSATDKRETTYEYDEKGYLLLETAPLSPHRFTKRDNVGRAIATGLFSATTNIVVGTDDPTTETSNRIGLSQAFYDERGDLWKSQRHKIDPDDGSDDDNLQYFTVVNEDRRVIATDGPDLTKTFYDGLGRVTHRFILASVNDTSYSDTDDVSGDIVLEENQTTYDPTSGDVIMVARIDRFHDDAGSGETTGALDTNADNDALQYSASNLEGRIQITALWYDDLDRFSDQVQYGTYGDSDFDRDGLSVPTRSDTALVTSYTYNDEGRLEKVTDPRDIDSYTEYDDAGRVTKKVRNYDSSVNSGNPSGTDDNVTVKYEYTDGLRTKLTADMPSGTDDQDTIYTYGTTKGVSAGDSKIETGHLLQKIQYPDSSGGSDVVTFAYNAQAEQTWKKDQAGNIFETDLDDTGNQEHYRWSTAASGFDTAVRRISRTYDDLRRPDLVTQYDNATVGSGSVVDEVRYQYDDWGPISQFDYDRDSAVDAVGSDDEYSVSYTYAEATGGRNTLRRTGMTLPSGNVITYSYESTDSHDDDVSRITEVKDGATSLCAYDYLGEGRVVGMTYDVPDVFRLQYGSTSGDYPDLDRFNRVTSDRWTKDLATDRDFFDTDITYDRNGNITVVEDNVHTGFDVSYDIDDLDRVTRAEEGTWGGSSISSRTRDQQWTLDHVGNWGVAKLDLNGDGDFVDTDESNDDRTHNKANELTARDTDDNGTDDFTLTFDALGNLTDDAESYEYEYDGFGRLRKIKDASDSSLIAEYRYNGLGHLTALHEDTDDDSDVDTNDTWFYRMLNERWQWVATIRSGDTYPKEEFVSHKGGFAAEHTLLSDLPICNNRDRDTSWTDASDQDLESRTFLSHNRHSDLSAIISDSGHMVEWYSYRGFSDSFGIPRGDTDSDGVTDSSDRTNIDNWSAGYDVRYDVNLSGTIDQNDSTAATDLTLGRGATSSVGNRVSYSAYSTLAHTNMLLARNRVTNTSLGTWITRDPLFSGDSDYLSFASAHTHVTDIATLGFRDHTRSDAMNLYGYVSGRFTVLTDPFGLESADCYCLYTTNSDSQARLEPTDDLNFFGQTKYKCTYTEWVLVEEKCSPCRQVCPKKRYKKASCPANAFVYGAMPFCDCSLLMKTECFDNLSSPGGAIIKIWDPMPRIELHHWRKYADKFIPDIPDVFIPF